MTTRTPCVRLFVTLVAPVCATTRALAADGLAARSTGFDTAAITGRKRWSNVARWEQEPRDPWYVELIQYGLFIFVAAVIFVGLTAVN